MFPIPVSGAARTSVLVFEYTGSAQEADVPSWASRCVAKVWGGGGHKGQSTYKSTASFVLADLAVTGGETLDIYVGGSGNYTGAGLTAPGGWPDGGDSPATDQFGSAGGSSSICRGALSHANALVVAGASGAGTGGGASAGGGDQDGAGGGTAGTKGTTSTGGTSGGGEFQGGQGGSCPGGGGYNGGGASSSGSSGGGGGASFVKSGITGSIQKGETASGANATPINSDDPHIPAGFSGDPGDAGCHGLIVLIFYSE